MATEALQVVETAASVFVLFIAYEEGDIAGAVGHVYKTAGDRRKGENPEQVLSTNDTLRVMWAAPGGALWIGSADGNVGTTAAVDWQVPGGSVRYEAMGSSPPWSVTALPRVRQSGLRPNVTALWGTGEADVYAGTYGGHVYRWDGASWTQSFEGPGEGNGTIRALGGGPDNVYAVGAQATLLHFDGRTWRRLQVPGPPNGHETFTGVAALPTGDVLIAGSGDDGRLLSGAAEGGLQEFGRYPLPLIDMAPIDGRILFATGDGVAELIGREIQTIKSTFKTATMGVGIGRLFFVEPAQQVPCFIEYRPGVEDAPWWRTTF